MRKIATSLGAITAVLLGGTALAGVPEAARAVQPIKGATAIGGWSHHPAATAKDRAGIVLVGNSSSNSSDNSNSNSSSNSSNNSSSNSNSNSSSNSSNNSNSNSSSNSSDNSNSNSSSRRGDLRSWFDR
jgi:hypothetical protein